MTRGIHGEKIVAAINGEKTPALDKPRLQIALQKYDCWIQQLNATTAETQEDLMRNLISKLNEYKNYIDIDLIFDSHEDFLYRQKGQLKLDNTVIEEFLPIFIKKCLPRNFPNDIEISSQKATFSSARFESSLSIPGIGGSFTIKTKDQDFSMCRKLYIKTSFQNSFPDDQTKTLETHIDYVLAELKTNLDKTMFQEASATAHDVKLAVPGAKYYLLCDFLDMTPISTTITDIDEILITRKAKRISSNLRQSFNTYSGRQQKRDWYIDFLRQNPYSYDIFKRFLGHIVSLIGNEELIEESVLSTGYF